MEQEEYTKCQGKLRGIKKLRGYKKKGHKRSLRRKRQAVRVLELMRKEQVKKESEPQKVKALILKEQAVKDREQQEIKNHIEIAENRKRNQEREERKAMWAKLREERKVIRDNKAAEKQARIVAMAKRKVGGWSVPQGRLLGGADGVGEEEKDPLVNGTQHQNQSICATASLDVSSADTLHSSICKIYGIGEESEAFFEAVNGLILKQFKPDNINAKEKLCAQFTAVKNSHHNPDFLRSVKKWGLVLSSAFNNKETFFTVFLNSVDRFDTGNELRDYGRRMKALCFWLKFGNAVPVRTRNLEHGSPLSSWTTMKAHEEKIIHLLKECSEFSDEDLNLFQSICISSLGTGEKMRGGQALNNRLKILKELRSASSETKNCVREALRFSQHTSTYLRMLSQGNTSQVIQMPNNENYRGQRDVHRASPAMVKAIDSFLSRVIQNPEALSFDEAFSILDKRMVSIKKVLDNETSRDSYARGMDKAEWKQTMDQTWRIISSALKGNDDFNIRLPKIVLYLQEKDEKDPEQKPGENRYMDLYLTASFTSSMTAYGNGTSIRQSCGKGIVERFSGEGLQGICDAVTECSGLKEAIIKEFVNFSNSDDFLKTFQRITAHSLYSGITLTQKRRILGEHIINEAVKQVCPDRSFAGGYFNIDTFFVEFDELSNFKEYVEYALEEFDEEMFGMQEFDFQNAAEFDKLAKSIFTSMPEGCDDYRKRDKIIQKTWDFKDGWLSSHPSTKDWIFDQLWQKRMNIFHKELLEVMEKTQVAGSGKAMELVKTKTISPLQALEWLLYSSILKEKPSELFDFAHDHQENIEHVLFITLEHIRSHFDILPSKPEELLKWAQDKKNTEIAKKWNYEETWKKLSLKDDLLKECIYLMGRNCDLSHAIKLSFLSPHQALEKFIAATIVKGKIYVAADFFQKHNVSIKEAIKLGETLRKTANNRQTPSISGGAIHHPIAHSAQVMTLTKGIARAIGTKCKEDPNFTATMKVDNSKLYSWQDVENLLPRVNLEGGVEIVMTFPGGLNKPKTFIQSHCSKVTGNIKKFVVSPRVKQENKAQMEGGVNELNQLLQKKKTDAQQDVNIVDQTKPLKVLNNRLLAEHTIKTFSLVMHYPTDKKEGRDVQWNVLKIEMLPRDYVWIIQTDENNIFVFESPMTEST